MSSQKIDMIVWDLGGVLMSVVKVNVARVFFQYTNRFSSIEEMVNFFVSPSDDWWNIVMRYDRGELTDNEFFEEMTDDLQMDRRIGLKQFISVWQSSLQFKPDMLAFVQSLYDNGAEQGIISNLSRAHHEVIFASDRLRREWFRLAMFSFAERCTKDLNTTEIFDRFIKAVGLRSNNILFIDDRLVYLVSAEKAGMQIFHFNRYCHHSANLKALIHFLQINEYRYI